MALEGANPLHRFPRYTATLELCLLSVALPAPEHAGGRATAGPALFDPPLGQQRMEAAAAALYRAGAASVLDLGKARPAIVPHAAAAAAAAAAANCALGLEPRPHLRAQTPPAARSTCAPHTVHKACRLLGVSHGDICAQAHCHLHA